MTRGRRILGCLVAVGAAAVAAFAWSSCGGGEFNIWQPIAQPLALKTDPNAVLEQARVDLDNQKYGTALSLLQPVVDDPKKDSDEARVLYAAAELGNAGFDLWDIISNVLSTEDRSSSGPDANGGGMDELLDSISDSVLGTGAARTAHVQALYDTVDSLQNSPDPSDPIVANVSCVVAAFLAVPTITDATNAMADMTAALQQISSTATGGGTVCPNISQLDTATAELTTASASFNYILQIAKTCSFLQYDSSVQSVVSQMNDIQQSLATLMKNADKGCASVPTCPASLPNCKELFPTCVQQALAVGSSTAKAGDGVLAPCEIVLNCLDPSACFPSL